MKKIVCSVLLFVFTGTCFAQEWMTDLDIAGRLAMFQNKMMFVVWQETTYYKIPVTVNTDNGQKVLMEDLFDSLELEELIWDNFVPVILSENDYPKLYNQIKNTRSTAYLDKFNEDFIKIMDPNGNIVNMNYNMGYVLNLSHFISTYGINLSYVKQELTNYRQEKTFYTAFYLSNKYVEFGYYLNENVRKDMVDLSNIYLDEAKEMMETLDVEDKTNLEQRVELLEIEQDLVVNNPKRVLRKLKRLEADKIRGVNEKVVAFLYFTAYRLLKDESNAAIWREKMSAVDYNKIMPFVNHVTGS